MKIAPLAIVLSGLITATSLPGAESPETPISKINIGNLEENRPRIMLTPEILEALRSKVSDDEVFKRIYRSFYAAAEELLDRPPVTYEKEGRRLLSVCQICQSRIILLSMIYRISGEERFLERAEKEMLAAAAFPDWNPDHYLDTGEMTAALGIGLDWLHSELSPETREIIADAIYEKGLRTLYLEDGAMRKVMFTNWTQICYGGLSIGALAIAEKNPGMAEEILNLAANRTTALVEGWHSPEGAYVEGPGYWDYGTSFHVMLMDALLTSLGSDFNMGAVPGLRESSPYRVVTRGPTGLLFN